MNSDRPSSQAIFFDPVLLVATGFGFGYAPVAPGTFGTLWGLPLTWAIHQIQIPDQYWLTNIAQIAVIFALGLIGIPLCGAAARRLGKKEDPGEVVWDEIASLPIVFLFVPWDAYPGWSKLVVLMVGFLLHRVFDISKPPPCRQAEKLPGGLGIMADDWIAAAYGCLALHLGLWAYARLGI